MLLINERKKTNKTNNLLIHVNFCRMEMNDIQIDDVIIDVDMAYVEFDGTSTEGYSDPLEADVD